MSPSKSIVFVVLWGLSTGDVPASARSSANTSRVPYSLYVVDSTSPMGDQSNLTRRLRRVVAKRHSAWLKFTDTADNADIVVELLNHSADRMEGRVTIFDVLEDAPLRVQARKPEDLAEVVARKLETFCREQDELLISRKAYQNRPPEKPQ